MSTSKTIGIVGGVGPFAGLDLNEKIFRQTLAGRDQEHLNVILISYGAHITDRTAYLIGKEKINPAKGIYRTLAVLEDAGVYAAGIPCNTSHAPAIWDEILFLLNKNNHTIKLVNMIEETGSFIKSKFPDVHTIGILGTTGTMLSEVYSKILSTHGYKIIYPDRKIQDNKVHKAVYDGEYGIKAQSYPVSNQARSDLREAVDHLVSKNADAIVLGCTEIPLAVKESKIKEVPLIDATLILARSLIKIAAPEKLQPL